MILSVSGLRSKKNEPLTALPYKNGLFINIVYHRGKNYARVNYAKIDYLIINYLI